MHVPLAIDFEACRRYRIDPRAVQTGCIIGTVQLTNCVAGQYPSKWAEPGAAFHWILEQPKLLAKPFPTAGKLGLFRTMVPARLLRTHET